MHEDRIRALNAVLPTKRAIAQGLLRDPAGRVLLCELTYKSAWDLPGGVVESAESPLTGCRREVAEELGREFAVHGLLAVNWMSPWRGWDDACCFVFDMGVHDASLVDSLELQAREIRAVQWCTPQEVAQRAAPATARLLAFLEAERAATAAGGRVGPWYLEDGAAPA